MLAAPRALIDLGNHRLKLLLAGARAPLVWPWEDPSARQAFAAALQEAVPEGETVWLSSSSPKAQELLAPCWQKHLIHVLAAEEVPLLRRSEGTGTDRLLAGYAAWRSAGGQRAVSVASLGTAFTLDLITADGQFLGGAIGPGLGLQQEALRHACPHLPPAQASRETPPRHSATAVDAGTRRALAAALRGLAAEFIADTQATPEQVLHGGDADAMAPLLPGWRVRHHLVLSGMRLLAQQAPLGGTWAASGV